VSAALTFSPGQALVLAVILLALVLVTIWGIAEAEHDRVRRAHDRQLRREARHVKGEQ
jgi:type II secretory pathway component PulK